MVEGGDDEDVLFRPAPGAQAAALAAAERDVLIGGAKGMGKSDILVVGAARYAHRPLHHALLVRTTWGEVQELIDRSQRYYPRLDPRPAWDGENRRWRFPAPDGVSLGARVQFAYVDDVADIERVQGREWSYIGYDEMGKQRNAAVPDMLLKELRCKDKSIVRMFRASANPGQAGHTWIKRRYIIPCGADGSRVVQVPVKLPDGTAYHYTRRFVPGRVWDNPVYAEDREYLAQLASLPEVLRRQLLYGDWDAGEGLALDELDERRHFVRPFEIPAHWVQYGAFDWGFDHPWVFGWYAVNEDGRIYKIDTITGRKQPPWRIAEEIRRKVPVDRLHYIAAGHDIWNERRAEGFDGPTIQEQLAAAGVVMSKANISRVQGLSTLRMYTAWRGMDVLPSGDRLDGDPLFVLFDTPGNRWCYSVLESMVTDPDDREDVLEVEADAERNVDGDDAYDETRYGVSSRPPSARSVIRPHLSSGWSREVLQAEMKAYRTVGGREKLHARARPPRHFGALA